VAVSFIGGGNYMTQASIFSINVSQLETNLTMGFVLLDL
jgi:hypothetical protein